MRDIDPLLVVASVSAIVLGGNRESWIESAARG